MLKSLIFLQINILNIKKQNILKQIIRYVAIVKYFVNLKKIEVRGRRYLVEKTIYNVEFSNLYSIHFQNQFNRKKKKDIEAVESI